ncbi:hypothetical protein HYDPIDRAFT_32533 [Hydnomerulius pinastri MD-312]|uniref:BTB domain-containing protein n=1 Tax=Hydnomerulius pinastri MD-312 TaxID=994086 RepID=A0A0C9W9T7_9AGAM|nr:hypothetical protein HYDPIDRAFT_32533 [Hydnomerulius pinastri MD-312]
MAKSESLAERSTTNSKSSITSQRLWCVSGTGIDVGTDVADAKPSQRQDSPVPEPQAQTEALRLEPAPTAAPRRVPSQMHLTALRDHLQSIRFARSSTKTSPKPADSRAEPPVRKLKQPPAEESTPRDGFKTSAEKASVRLKFLPSKTRGTESVRRSMKEKRQASVDRRVLGAKSKPARSSITRSSVGAGAGSPPITFQLVVEPWLESVSEGSSTSSSPVSATHVGIDACPVSSDVATEGQSPTETISKTSQITEIPTLSTPSKTPLLPSFSGVPIAIPKRESITSLVGSSTPSTTSVPTVDAINHIVCANTNGEDTHIDSVHNVSTLSPEHPSDDPLTETCDKLIPQVLKHDKFWLADGNVVIQADDARFRLHRSRLVEQSVIFAHVFGGAGTTNEDAEKAIAEEIEILDDEEGGKIYRLKSVSSRDLVFLLELDWDLLQFHFTTPTLSMLSSILRASTALRFERCRALAIKFLEADWPCSLSDITPERKACGMEVAILGRKCGVKGVLVRAFYELARANGGYGLSSTGSDPDGGQREEEGKLEGISKVDLALVDRVREHMVHAWAQTAARLSPPCPVHTGLECPSISSQREAWERLVHDSGVFKTFLFDPICGLQALVDIKWEEERWCEECVRVRREAWLRQRQELWEWVGAELDG